MQERVRDIAGYHSEGIDDRIGEVNGKEETTMGLSSTHLHTVFIFLFEVVPVLLLVRSRAATGALHAGAEALW
jgi:hypothetical protein